MSGVGPKLALALLSAMAPDALRLAIGQEQPDLLARVPGIGKKTAQKIVLELKDKVGPVEVAEGLAALTEADAAVIDALTALGYSIVEAQRAVQGLPRDRHRRRRAAAARAVVVRGLDERTIDLGDLRRQSSSVNMRLLSPNMGDFFFDKTHLMC